MFLFHLILLEGRGRGYRRVGGEEMRGERGGERVKALFRARMAT